MNSGFNRGQKDRLILFVFILFTGGVFLFWFWTGRLWTHYDAMVLDSFHALAADRGHGPKPAFMPRITYLTITDDTYHYFGKNLLDRKDLARINLALSELDPMAVAYDMIFARPGPEASDQCFARSLAGLESVYLALGCALSESPLASMPGAADAQNKFLSPYLIRPEESGRARPFHGVRVMMQEKNFMAAARGAGDISIRADPDGVYRHIPMLIRVGDDYLPSLSLAMFLGYTGISPEKIRVNWGEGIILPMGNNAKGQGITIPIDQRGAAYVPFVAPMGRDFPLIAVHDFLKAFEDKDLRGNVSELFEGRFVIIADTATGASDLGATPLERSTPLVTLHASMLNGLLTHTFYTPWTSVKVMTAIILMAILFGLSAVFRFSGIFYGSGLAVLTGLPLLAWFEFIHFRLFPLATVALAGALVFGAMVIALECTASRDRSLIRNIFSRYVPKAVVNALLANPENLNLGGEEKTATVLFSDLADFTSISERLSPQDLVSLLNHYLTEMTAIILEQGGIIDKFQGDAIMAEFGVPLPCADHADRAVSAGLLMQERLTGLRREWKQKGLPQLHCRIGINTGKMVVGNMGSTQVQDYTVMGDSVNLASRLEGANKFYGTWLMVSESTLGALTPDRFCSRVLDVLRVKGKSEAVKVYEVYGFQGRPMAKRIKDYYTCYEGAYTSYLDRDFKAAEQGFITCLDLKPGDPASQGVLRRIQSLAPDNLPPDWNGSVGLNSK